MNARWLYEADITDVPPPVPLAELEELIKE